MTHDEIVEAAALRMVQAVGQAWGDLDHARRSRVFAMARAALAVAGRVCREEAEYHRASEAASADEDDQCVHSFAAFRLDYIADRFAPPTPEPPP